MNTTPEQNDALRQVISHAIGRQHRVKVEYGSTSQEGYLTYCKNWDVLIKREYFHEYGNTLPLDGITRIVCSPGTLVLYEAQA